MNLREAAQMALEVLEYEATKGNDDAYRTEREALRTALEQPEPVARVIQTVGQYSNNAGFVADVWTPRKLSDGQPLYEHPPRREWQGLTDEEILSAMNFRDVSMPPDLEHIAQGAKDELLRDGRAIEAKLKEKNT